MLANINENLQNDKEECDLKVVSKLTEFMCVVGLCLSQWEYKPNIFIQRERKTALILPSLLMTLHTSFKPLPRTSQHFYEEFSSKFSCFLVHAFDELCYPSPNHF